MEKRRGYIWCGDLATRRERLFRQKWSAVVSERRAIGTGTLTLAAEALHSHWRAMDRRRLVVRKDRARCNASARPRTHASHRLAPRRASPRPLPPSRGFLSFTRSIFVPRFLLVRFRSITVDDDARTRQFHALSALSLDSFLLPFLFSLSLSLSFYRGVSRSYDAVSYAISDR